MKTLACVLLMFSGMVLAEVPIGWPTLKVRGVEYKDVKVTARDASSIKIIHADGAARILIKDLPEEIQKQFAYDPDTAKANETKLETERHRDQVAAQKAEKEKATSDAERGRLKKLQWQYMSLIVDRVVPGGLICYSHTPGGMKGFAARAIDELTGTGGSGVVAPHTGSTPMFVEGVKGKYAKGDVLTGYGARDGVKDVQGETLQRWVSKPDGLKTN